MPDVEISAEQIVHIRSRESVKALGPFSQGVRGLADLRPSGFWRDYEWRPGVYRLPEFLILQFLDAEIQLVILRAERDEGPAS